MLRSVSDIQGAVDPIRPASDRNAPKQVICDETVRACMQRYGTGLLAIVLTGSLARDEATFAKQHNGWKPLSDAEFLLVVRDRTPLPSLSILNADTRDIQSALAQRGLPCCVSLSAVHTRYLERLQPHIFAYELQAAGLVVWGDSRILSNIPAFSPADLPLEDAWRLLCNRVIEQLETLDDLDNRSTTLPVHMQYRTIKLFLDMATSYLLFIHEYEPTYRARAEKMRTLAGSAAHEAEAPFPLGRFAVRVIACTRAKLTGQPDEEMSRVAFWEEAAAYAVLLCRWELGRLTGAKGPLSHSELFTRMMRAQSIPQRMRGWAYVLRKQGWLTSWREWVRWGSLCRRGSPRYWTYAAAFELFVRLPCLMNHALRTPEHDLKWEELRRWLPVVDGSEVERDLAPWRRLASDIVRNYHRFLEHTRA